MKEIKIVHNPYKVETQIAFDGKAPAENSQFIQYLNDRFQLWVGEIPRLLVKETNCTDLKIIFKGTKLDYDDLHEVANCFDGATFELEHIEAKPFGEKEKELRTLFD